MGARGQAGRPGDTRANPNRLTMNTTGEATTPVWITSQRKARGDCQQCGTRPYITEWAGTGLLLCAVCCQGRRDAYTEHAA